MYGKIEITGVIEIKTGMHIGGSSEFSAIGATDSPVMKDSLTGYSIIPGSSFKGKLRYLLSRKYNKGTVRNVDQDAENIKRLFGSSIRDAEDRINKSRLIFSDMILSNAEELSEKVDTLTEVKFENTINRFSAVANPRQIERTIRGSKFDMSIIYNANDEKEALEDLELLKEAFELLKYDYIGGHGSRGYGRVEISNLNFEVLTGDYSDDFADKIEGLCDGN